MNISYNWLRQFIAITETPEELGVILTSIGLEVEGIAVFESIQGGLQGIVIGEVITCERHPNADKLSKTTVDIGGGNIAPIVCGAPNVAQGQKVIVATVGAKLYPTGGEPFEIKKAKIRGEESQGMICAEDEIGLGHSHDGIMVLDTNLPNGTPAADYFQVETDYIISIGLTPNRADAASHMGVARDLAAKLNRKLKLPDISELQVTSPTFKISVKVENSEACPRFSGVCIADVKVAESPTWLQNRLKSIGLRPINNIVDITNYVQHELGQPLHAYNADQIAGKQILVKTLPQDTIFLSLDGQERKLSENDLMICDGESKGMCIGGVFGGLTSGVTENTHNVFLECAYFSPDYIRRTSQYHGLKTDASFRFERGVNPNGNITALKRAVHLICELAGGKIADEIVDIYPTPIGNFSFSVKWANIDRLIGKKLDRTWIKELLARLEIGVSEETETTFIVSVPPYRVDVLREADIIEEIARMYGLDNLELSENLGADYLADFPVNDPDKIRYKITTMLASLGFSETMTNSLTSPKYAEATQSLLPESNVEILNQLSEELAVMRQTLLFSGLEVLAYNINRKQKDLKTFEFGKTYHRKEGEDLKKYYEKSRLALFVTGNQHAETWQTKTQETNFFDLASAVQKILQRMNITNRTTERISNDIFSDGVIYKVKSKEVAVLGLVQKKLLKITDLKQTVWYADLDWDYLLKQYKADLTYTEVSKFPEVQRDLSLVLDKKVTFQQIQALAWQKERKLLKSVNVFDVYEGESLGKDKKAYALRFILEDNTQTLTEDTISKVMSKLRTAFEQELGAMIRV
jgi:phenylalanyl-tRNA synthetase beta chain